MGKIKAIIKSPNMDREHLCTLMPVDKGVIDDKNLQALAELYSGN